MDLNDRCWLDISLPAFTHNIGVVKTQLAGEALLMVAVKSDAYGHGQEMMAPAAVSAGADALAVLDIETGVALRRLLPNVPMLCWLLSPGNDFQQAIDASLDMGVSHVWQLRAIEEAHITTPVRLHLKIDTGLHRNGALWRDWPALVAEAARLEGAGIAKVVGIWSHLADTSIAEDNAALERFHKAVAVAREAGLHPTLLHIAASAAAMEVPEARLDLVRVGLIAYGVSPFEEVTAQDLNFQPVMTARARVVEIEGSTVTLGMGYTDGLLPIPPQTGWVLINGEKAPIESLGVDTLTVSRPAGVVHVGDVATLWGEPAQGSPRVEDWAAWAGTIGDEVIVGVSPRVHRNYLTS